jgi:hypothetical protein
VVNPKTKSYISHMLKLAHYKDNLLSGPTAALCYMAFCGNARNTHLVYVSSHVSTEIRYNEHFHRSVMILRVDIAYMSILGLLLGFFGRKFLLAQRPIPQRDARIILL